MLPDRLLAEAAWDLWDEYRQQAPSVIEELKRFWGQTSPFGTAVLILDGLSLRELPLILRAAADRGIAVLQSDVWGTEVPPETDSFAAALGLPSRSKLKHNHAPGTFIFAGSDVHTDVLDMAFEDCVTVVPSKPRLFLWNTWPDEALIHLHAGKTDGPQIVAEQTRKELNSDGFWNFIDRMRQGRRLVITGDHGYAVSKLFSGEFTDEARIKLFKDRFGAQRSAADSATEPWPRQHFPPLVSRQGEMLVVMGQRKWKVSSGFPYLSHGGLTLLEVAVPLIELPAL
jgi:hypothetical protein